MPDFVKEEGTLYRMCIVLASEKGRVLYLRLKQPYDTDDLTGNRAKEVDYDSLAGLYNGDDPIYNELGISMEGHGIDNDVPSNYDELDSKHKAKIKFKIE